MNKPIPVLHVINDCTEGSISRIIERIMLYSPKNEFEWHVGHVKPGQMFSDNFKLAGGNVIDFSSEPGDESSPEQQIRSYALQHGIQIIHSHTPRTTFTVWSALNWGKPSLKTHITHLATKHLLTGVGDRRLGILFAAFDRFSLYLPDMLIPVSHTMAKVIAKQIGIKPTRVNAIPNAIPVEDYYRPAQRNEFRNEIGLSPNMLAVGFTGRLTKVKCLDLLLNGFNEIFPLYPNARLIIAGEGDLRPALHAQAERLKINNAVIWLGFYHDIPRLLSGLDIYIQPSKNEGLSLSVLEAMASQNPVIATKVGSAEEIITDGKNGILIEPGESAGIATALLTLFSNEDMRTRLARNGREFVVKEYNVQKMVDGYCEVYREQRKERQKA